MLKRHIFIKDKIINSLQISGWDIWIIDGRLVSDLPRLTLIEASEARRGQ